MNLTIRNSTTAINASNSTGGTIILRNCRIEGNTTALLAGSGAESVELRVIDSRISDNTTGISGFVPLTLSDSEISNNSTASVTGSGSLTWTISGCLISDNGAGVTNCGFAPRPLGRRRLLLASHVKPWCDCTGERERLDPRNGIAACPVHGAAFDSGLLTVNGGLRIHLSPLLQSHVLADRVAENFFGHPPLGERLQVPAGSAGPDPSYLEWHRTKLFGRASSWD